MKILFPSITETFNQEEKCVIIGNFDGVHLGHDYLFKSLEKEKKYKKLVITFSNSMYNNQTFLMPFEQKLIYITENYKIDYLAVFEYNTNFISIEAIHFIRFLKINHVKKVICNREFKFGRNCFGNIAVLREHFIVEEIESKSIHEQKISSSIIKEFLNLGDIYQANLFLGRKYEVKGKIVEGLRLGRTINFPTINIDYENYYLPKNGVYEVQVEIDNKIYRGFCNIGINPTVAENKIIKFEVHIFDFDFNVYYKTANIYFVDFIREEKKFNNLGELKQELIKNKQKILDKYHS